MTTATIQDWFDTPSTELSSDATRAKQSTTGSKPLSPGEYVCELRKAGGLWRFVRQVVVMDQALEAADLKR